MNVKENIQKNAGGAVRKSAPVAGRVLRAPDRELMLLRNLGNDYVQRMHRAGLSFDDVEPRTGALMRSHVGTLRRDNINEDEEIEGIQTKLKVGPNAVSRNSTDLDAGVAEMRSGGGRPLSDTERAFFEPRFGYDFSKVRVHNDDRAARLSQSLNARAFTAGSDIAFGAGEHAPDTTEGRRLMAHELAHVVQQEGGESKYIRRRKDNKKTSEASDFLSNIRSGGYTANSLIYWHDSKTRIDSYVKPAQKLAQMIFEDFESGKLGHIQARNLASTGRNQLLAEARKKLSPGGRAFSKSLKEEGYTIEILKEKYAKKILASDVRLMNEYGLTTLDQKSSLFDSRRFQHAIKELGETPEVSKSIIMASGRFNKVVTGMARIGKFAGPAGILIGGGISTYEILTAPQEQQLFTFGRELFGFIGGLLGAVGGGLGAAWAASLICGPATAVCAIIVTLMFVGAAGYGGGLLFEKGYEYVYEKFAE